ncbi:hypothetical protein [Streptomyces griseocarneus]|uniref:hypothetical protein n=1 Tax=Streptomyces griseocarneus TaxID=51201 RepID=UPI00167E98CF|nr:hypothetical protein [Streptomyces griseocarneus]MBZ6477023.1 hypothetical protein [Streptomyces griseocarneus]GHG70009.1 hypothetical protein GCM10018779_43770 [Streptomyces griseocarneus]
MTRSPVSRPGARPETAAPTTLRQRLAELRGPAVAPQPLDARALAALAANPGCHRRALLDGAGVDKAALAGALGSPATFGQSQFAFVRGHAFEARVKDDGGTGLIRLLCERLGDGPAPPPGPGDVDTPDLAASGPEGRTARTALALREATAAGRWALLDHPMLALSVAGTPAYLEPDAVVVHPDGGWTVVEIKSFAMVDGAADAAKVGAAARQAAVYALALEPVAERVDGASVRHRALLVCPKNFSNLPDAALVDLRKQLATTRRQLDRLTGVADIADGLPEGTTFDLCLADDGRTPTRPAEELAAAVDAVGAAYAPECLAACELAFHCRARSRAADAVQTLGRALRAELGGLTTIEAVLAAAAGEAGDPADPAVAALRRAARLRAESLETAGAASCP